MTRPIAFLALLAWCGLALGSCQTPYRPPDAGGPADAVAPDDADPGDTGTPSGPLAYTPEGCAHMVRTPPGARNNVRSRDGVFGPMPEPRFAHTTWAADPSRSVAVLWNTDLTTDASVVQYGTTMAPAGLTMAARGHASTGGMGSSDGMSNVVRSHEAHLCGLTPDTTYYYRVGGEGHWSEVQSFKTAPAPGAPDADVNFAVTGDSRDSMDIWRQVQARVMAASGARQPDFQIFSGDAVFLGTSQPAWNQWLESAAVSLRRMPFVMAHGNHDALAVNYLMQFAQPQAGTPEQDELYFSLDYGPLHVVVLNDSPVDITTLLSGAQRQWLEADLRAVDRARTPWVLVVHHKPAFSSSRHSTAQDTTQIRGSLPPVFAMYGVDLVLNGHDHDFEVTHPLLGDGTRATGQRGTVYVTAAGAGAELYPSGTSPWTRHAESVVNFALVHATRATLELVPYRLDGTVIEPGRTTLTRP